MEADRILIDAGKSRKKRKKGGKRGQIYFSATKSTNLLTTNKNGVFRSR
jgi:hypothetical protein